MCGRAGLLAVRTRHVGAAVDIADVAAAEDVAVAVGHALGSAYLAAVDLHLGRAEDVAVGVERALLAVAPNVVALAAAEDVAAYVTVVYLDVRGAGLVDALQLAHGVGLAALVDGAAAHGGNLGAAVYAVAHLASPDGDLGVVDAASHVVASAEHVAAVAQAALALPHLVDVVCLVVDLLFVALSRGTLVGHGVALCVLCLAGVQVNIAYVAVVQRQVGRAEDGTALAAAVGIALYGGHALQVAIAVGQRGLVLAYADDHVSLAQDVALGAVRVGLGASVTSHVALPSAAIDIAAGAALDVGVGRSGEVLSPEIVEHGADGASGVDILLHRAAQQGHVGGAVDVAAAGYAVAAESAAVGVVVDGGALLDDDVGVVGVGRVLPVVHLSPPDQGGVAEVGDSVVFVGRSFRIFRISRIFRSFRVIASAEAPGSLPFGRVSVQALLGGKVGHVCLHALGVQHVAFLGPAIDLVDLCAVLEVHLGVFGPGI